MGRFSRGKGRKVNKEQYNLNQKLDAIWRTGDRDEMSLKHVAHGLAALVAFGDWKQAQDYRLPNWFDFGSDQLNQNAYRNLEARLVTKWAKIEELFGEWGAEKFTENAKATNYGFYFDSYLNDSFLDYSKAVAA